MPACVLAAFVLLSVALPAAVAQTNTNANTGTAPNTVAGNDLASLKSLPFEQLVNLEVTTVSKRSERLVDAPSAIQVITSEDIHRSGASSLPEALRLANNLQVAQIDSQQWAISSRGFNSAIANKLLVLIDGRSVYTPLFSGVFWDVQNVMLEDVDRIEVISGPGATLWGANAVNGVVNVISKSARDTQGGLVSAGGGTFLDGFANARYGDKIGENLYFRLYGMGFKHDNTLLHDGTDATNDWYMSRGGFRADWLPASQEVVTFQGDFYGGTINQANPRDTTVDGQNLLSRWTHPIADASDMTLQLYWDRTWRVIPNVLTEKLNTYDIDYQHRLAVGNRNRVIWGAGYRLLEDEVANSPAISFLPAHRSLQRYSAFVQDEIALVESQLALTVGTKLEHNDYTGFEFQPSGRLAWMPLPDQTIWGAVSRAVRSPSRIDTEVFVPTATPPVIQGGGDRFDSETVIAYELGYRTELNRSLSVSVSTFFNDYDDLRSVEPIPGAPGQNIILNRLSAESYGVELASTWQPLDWWRLRGGYTYFVKHLFFEDSLDLNQGRREGNDPHHQFQLQSMVNLPANLQWDGVLRYVDNLNQSGPTVPAYVALDLRLGWSPIPHWELSVVGQNLLDNQHPEFGLAATRQEIPRSVYGRVAWKF